MFPGAARPPLGPDWTAVRWRRAWLLLDAPSLVAENSRSSFFLKGTAATVLFKAGFSHRSHICFSQPFGMRHGMHVKWKQAGSRRQLMSKHLFLRPPPNESQTPHRRDATFTSHKQSPQ